MEPNSNSLRKSYISVGRTLKPTYSAGIFGYGGGGPVSGGVSWPLLSHIPAHLGPRREEYAGVDGALTSLGFRIDYLN